MRKLLCFIGYHRWTWKLSEGQEIDLNAPPPDDAFCYFCYKDYKNPNKFKK